MKPQVRAAVGYIIAGLCFGVVLGFGFIIYALSGLGHGYSIFIFNDSVTNLIMLFLTIFVSLVPLGFYLSKFYGLVVWLFITPIAVFLTTVFSLLYNNRIIS
ncbi:MAG TPA: hypothetical protein VLE47_04390 [Candidatus Saccharimonadales bacterium]|nr:hypothetical protein [Candidatus Saccharimonadales bacterium]